jgi:hypothetical protein
VDRLALKTPAVDSPKAQMFGCTAACFTERVEDNAFHLEVVHADMAAEPDSLTNALRTMHSIRLYFVIEILIWHFGIAI